MDMRELNEAFAMDGVNMRDEYFGLERKELCNMTVKEFVDEVYASYNRDEDTNYVFFLGAGCSKSSGIPLAGELALEWFFELKKENIKFDRFIDEHIQAKN